MSNKSLSISKSDKKKILDAIVETRNYHVTGPVISPSGNKCPIIIAMSMVISDPKRLEIIANAMASLVKKLPVDVIVGIPTAGLPLATAVSMLTKLPLLWVRDKPDPRTGSIEGEYKPGQRAI